MATDFLYAVDKLLAFVIDSSGRAKGTSSTPDSIDASSDTVHLPAHVVTHTVTVAPAGATFANAIDRGGSVYRGTNSIGLEDPGAVTLTFSNLDSMFDTLISGGSVDTTYNTSVRRGGRDDMRSVPPIIGIIALQKASKRDTTTPEVGFIGRYYVGQVRGQDPEINQNGGVNPSPLTYTMTLQTNKQEPTGVPFSDITGLNYTDDTTITHMMDLDYQQFMVDTFVVDGTDTTLTLQYLPLFNDATATGRNIIAKNGVQTAVTSVNTSTGVVTLAAAGTVGDVWVICYPTRFATA